MRRELSFLLQTGRSLLELDNPRSLESLVGAVFGHGAHTLGREDHGNGAVKLRHENTLLLEVSLLTDSTRWVELRGAYAVRVAACDLGALFCYWTDFGHILRLV